MDHTTKNPLGSGPIGKLMLKFAIPSIVAMLVSAIYNIVDQLFIGHAVGELGNAATNVAFPLSTVCTAAALLFGIGGASNFNLSMGAGEKKEASYYIGNALSALTICGVVIAAGTLLFLEPLLIFCGSPEEVLPYVKTYVSVSAIGFPFLILTIGGGHLMRADGSPKMTMFCSLSGAVINTVLDALFVLVFDMGMFGAALATIIGQIFSAGIVIYYFVRMKRVELTREHFALKAHYLVRTASLGMASFFNQLAMMVVQVVLNQTLTYYGGLSIYGKAIPLACAGIINKVNMIFMGIVIGIAQGTQPIESFNYGAMNYKRVKSAYKLATACGAGIAAIFFILFQLCPRQILMLFGSAEESYYEFGVNYFRIFLFFTVLNFLQPITATFFTSIGKPYKGIFLSLTRQILFLLPLVVVLPKYMGIDGILYAGPIADFMAAVAAVVMVWHEMRLMQNDV